MRERGRLGEEGRASERLEMECGRGKGRGWGRLWGGGGGRARLLLSRANSLKGGWWIGGRKCRGEYRISTSKKCNVATLAMTYSTE